MHPKIHKNWYKIEKYHSHPTVKVLKVFPCDDFIKIEIVAKIM